MELVYGFLIGELTLTAQPERSLSHGISTPTLTSILRAVVSPNRSLSGLTSNSVKGAGLN